MPIRLDPVTRENWRQVIAVEVAGDQRRFLDSESVLHALAEVQFYPTYTPYAVRTGDEIVGFVSYGHLPQDRSKWWIPLLIIDGRHQGNGYGRAAMEAIIERIQREEPECEAIGLGFKPENAVARRLYEGLGFATSGFVDEQGNVDAWLAVGPSR